MRSKIGNSSHLPLGYRSPCFGARYKTDTAAIGLTRHRGSLRNPRWTPPNLSDLPLHKTVAHFARRLPSHSQPRSSTRQQNTYYSTHHISHSSTRRPDVALTFHSQAYHVLYSCTTVIPLAQMPRNHLPSIPHTGQALVQDSRHPEPTASLAPISRSRPFLQPSPSVYPTAFLAREPSEACLM